jgi:hypothetical protein
MRLRHELVEIGQRAVHGIDMLMVGHVVSEIDLERRIERGDPQRVDVEVLEIREPRVDAVQAADPVAIGILARICALTSPVVPAKSPGTAYGAGTSPSTGAPQAGVPSSKPL